MYYSLVIVAAIILSGSFYYYKKSRKISVGDVSDNDMTPTGFTDETKKEEAVATPDYTVKITHDLSKQSIFLLGDFRVKDKNGNDITSSFTPTLKLLLITLILSSEEHPDGISGEDLDKILWSNKNKYAARNNRNVSLSKLRGLFSQIGNITVVNQHNHWKIIFGEDVLCDYNEIITYYRAMKDSKLNDKKHIDRLTDLLYRGSLLYHSEHESFNKHKGTFTYKTVDFLTEFLSRDDITDNKLKIKITNTILQHDCLNENGMRQKCKLLQEQGDLEAVSACYKKFCIDYFNLLGIKYTKKLQEVIKD